MRSSVAHQLKRLCAFLSVCLIFTLLLTSCDPGNTPTPDPAIGEEYSSFVALEEIEDEPTVLTQFKKTKNTAFLKLEITNVYEDPFVRINEKTYSYTHFVLLECRVVSDLYEGGFKEGDKITLPIILNVNKNTVQTVGRFEDDYEELEISDVKAWLGALDYIYAVSAKITPTDYSDSYFEYPTINVSLKRCTFTDYTLIPCKDGAISINSLYSFLNVNDVKYSPLDEIHGMDKFCFDGLASSEFELNVKKLSEYFDLKK